MDQRCTPTRVVVNRNWEDYMWPVQIDKTSRLDPEVLIFLKKLNLSKLTGIFINEEVINMEIVLTLNDEDLKGIDIKLGDRKTILKEISKLNKSKKISSFLTLGR